jgi:siroheme synthase-like protein
MSTQPPARERPLLFPVFLKLGGRRVLLVGGGRVAAGRLASLHASGARVTLVATEIAREAQSAVETLAERVMLRPFRPDDLDGAWLVVAAATRDVNRSVAAAAESRGVFVNAVDDADSASVFGGAVLRRCGITVALSTGGRAPALAGLLREALEAAIPEDATTWLAVAEELRQQQKARGVPMAERRPLLFAALERLYAGHGAGAVDDGAKP